MKNEGIVKRNNEFVHKVQREMAAKMGDRPGASPEMLKFNAYMCNDGAKAQSAARDLTKGLDKSAFPVK